jgi:hypothetical protein
VVVLHAAYPRMEAWFQWFNRTQHGTLKGSFRWRGRQTPSEYDRELNRKTFASGACSCKPIGLINAHVQLWQGKKLSQHLPLHVMALLLMLLGR